MAEERNEASNTEPASKRDGPHNALSLTPVTPFGERSMNIIHITTSKLYSRLMLLASAKGNLILVISPMQINAKERNYHAQYLSEITDSILRDDVIMKWTKYFKIKVPEQR